MDNQIREKLSLIERRIMSEADDDLRRDIHNAEVEINNIFNNLREKYKLHRSQATIEVRTTHEASLYSGMLKNFNYAHIRIDPEARETILAVAVMTFVEKFYSNKEQTNNEQT